MTHTDAARAKQEVLSNMTNLNRQDDLERLCRQWMKAYYHQRGVTLFWAMATAASNVAWIVWLVCL